MADKSLRLTTREAAYQKYVIEGMSPIQAAKAAGFAQPKVMAAKLTDCAKVQAAIRTGQALWLEETALGLAQNVVESVLRDDDAPIGARIKAASLVFSQIERANADGSMALPDAPASLSEVQARIRELEARVAADEKTLIDVTPIDPLS